MKRTRGEPYISTLFLLLTSTRLHVNIFDTDKQQFTIPESVIKRPAKPSESYIESSDIEFNYDASPFAFWITRRSEPHAAPLFDTRLASMPGSNQSSTLFPLIFEDRYLQASCHRSCLLI